MDKRRFKIIVKGLEDVKIVFLKPRGGMKENISKESVIFLFTYQDAKSQHRKNIFYFVVLGFKAEMFSLELHLAKYDKRYCMKLNSLGYDIYLRVIWIQFKKSFLRPFY